MKTFFNTVRGRRMRFAIIRAKSIFCLCLWPLARRNQDGAFTLTLLTVRLPWMRSGLTECPWMTRVTTINKALEVACGPERTAKRGADGQS